MSAPFIIVGAAQAGLQVAESLRSEGYAGEILLIGEEVHPPYQRPPLSKQLLCGETTEHRLIIRGQEALAAKSIELVSGKRVTGIDRPGKKVRFSDGSHQAYDALALTTGARARALPVPGAELEGVITLRTIEDCRYIAAALAQASKVAVIGGGFIGLEVAAAARKFGKDVTVFEALDRLLARSAAPFLSDFFKTLHETQGVSIRLATQITAFVGQNGHVTGVIAGDGRRHPADLVVVGIGIIPNSELAHECDLSCDRGIIVDACSRTSDPSIVAAGDCTALRLPDGSLRRLESVQNAVEQGKSAAAALLGAEHPFTAAPWFWSDQYDAKLQMAGLSAGHDRLVVRGSTAERRFSVLYFKGETLIAVDAVNRPHDYMAGRKLLDLGRSPDLTQAADERVNLASLAR